MQIKNECHNLFINKIPPMRRRDEVLSLYPVALPREKFRGFTALCTSLRALLGDPDDEDEYT